MIIDTHVHLPGSPWPDNPKHSWFSSSDDAVAYLKDAGVDRAVFNTWQGVFADSADDLETGNRDALRLLARHPDFLTPGAVIHPAFPALSEKWLANFRDLGLYWVGELVPYKCKLPFDAPEWLKLFEECRRHGHIVQLHGSPEVLTVARRFPEMTVVMSHIPDNPEEAAACPNLLLDISGAAGGLHVGALERALAAFGPDRLLFGSDFTGCEPRAFIERVKAAAPVRELSMIFSGNAKKLFGRFSRG